MTYRVVRTITLDYDDRQTYLDDSQLWYLSEDSLRGQFGPNKKYTHDVQIIGYSEDIDA